jgi:hypothetical protein
MDIQIKNESIPGILGPEWRTMQFIQYEDPNGNETSLEDFYAIIKNNIPEKAGLVFWYDGYMYISGFWSQDTVNYELCWGKIFTPMTYNG